MDNDLNKTTDTAAMTRVTRDISAMRSLLISNRFIALILAAVQLYYIFNGIRLYTALYILLTDLLFPMIMEGLIKGKLPQNDDLPLPMLRKKYRYTPAASKALSTGFLLNIVMMIAWHYNYTINPPEQEMLQSLPSALLFAYVAVRVIIWISYLLLFKYTPDKLMK